MGLISSMQNLFSNLFFSRDADGFNYFSTNRMLGQKGVVWADTTKPAAAYESTPQLKAVIDKKAIMFSTMSLIIVDKDGNKKEDPLLYKLLENPNPMQSQNEFLRNFKTQEQVYGNQYIYKNQASKIAPPSALWNVSAAYMSPIVTGKIWDQVTVDGIVSGYQYNGGDEKKIFPSSEILHQKISSLDNPILGTSPIISLKYPVTNTRLAYEYRNAIHSERGALGMITTKQKDSMGSIKLDKEDRETIERDFASSYGTGWDEEGKKKRAVKITDIETVWTPMSFPVGELKLFEEVDAAMIAFCDAFGLNINIFSNKSATFENVRSSIIQAYQDTIIPEADSFCQALTKFLGLKNGDKIVADFSHIQVLKADDQKEAQTVQMKLNSVEQLLSAGIITIQQAQQMTQTVMPS